MTDKELKRLNRSELLEILLDQAKEIESLKEEIGKLEEEKKDRRILLEESGSIAEASLKLTEVFTEAQKAADLYLENAKRVSEEKTRAADTYEAEHKAKADEIMAKSMEDSRKMIYEAKEEADRAKGEAAEEAAKTVADSKTKAAQLLENTQARCAEMEARAKNDSQAYWDEVRVKIQALVDEHQDIKDLFMRINIQQ